MEADKNRWANLKTNFQASARHCESYTSQQIILVSRFRVEFTAVCVNAEKEFDQFAKTEIMGINAVLDNQTNIVELWVLTTCCDGVTDVMKSLVTAKELNKNVKMGDICRNKALFVVASIEALEAKTVDSKQLVTDHAKITNQKRHDEFKSRMATFKHIPNVIKQITVLLFHLHDEVASEEKLASIASANASTAQVVKETLDCTAPDISRIGRNELNADHEFYRSWLAYGDAVFSSIES